MIDTRHFNTWIEVSESAYAANLRFFRRLIGPGVELSAVVKSNAYGHGMEEIAGLAVRHGVDSFCVHTLDEALRLRRAGFDQDVLIMGHVPLSRLAEAVAEDFRMVLYNRQSARRLAELAADRDLPVRAHLKIETGTYRQGIDEQEVDWFVDFLGRHRSVAVEGTYTHFANIEDTTEHGYARRQLERFERVIERLRNAGFGVPKPHTACSAATLLFPETYFGMVRLGLSQYGLWPSKETLLSFRMARSPGDVSGDESADLQPVLTWKTRISQLKRVPSGSYVGYGCSYQTTRESRIAVLPIGYADGYDRRLSSQAWVLVRGRRSPVRGRVCMNLIMVDVTDVPEVKLEDEVVLLGASADGEQHVTADQLAGLVGTINYEIVARLSTDLPRIVVA